MAHIEGTNRSQTLLLPEAVDDYVGADNPVRFIDAFVDELDLEKAGFARTAAKATGRPGYHPGDLLKLYIYGYLNRVRSSRRLEAETHRNLEVIWLLKRLQPDFKTIADFRRDNRAAFREVFRAFVVLCRGLDLFGRELLAVDGTRLKAVNNEDRNFTEAKLKRDLAKSDERLARYLEQLDEADKVDDGGPGSRNVEQLRDKIKAIKERRDRLLGYRAQIESNGEGQLSLTDPDARGMPAKSGVNVGYNIQIAVDVKHKLIVEQQVHSKVSDVGLLTDTAVAARKILDVDQSRPLPTKAITRSRIFGPVRRPASCLTCRGQSAVQLSAKASSPRRIFVTTPRATSISVPAVSSCPPPAGAVRSETSSSQIIPIRLLARDVRCACDAPTAGSAKSVDTKVRNCSTRWLLDWKLGPTC